MRNKGNNKKRIILTSIILLFIIIGAFIVLYAIDANKFYSSLKKYNDEYLMKMTYLVVDKDKVPENINLDSTFPGYTNEIIYTNSELVMLEKKGDYLYLDLNGQINKTIIQNEVDYVFALNDFEGNVLKDCEYDKDKNIAKIPVSYYDNKTQNVPIQLEIESAITEKDLTNVEVKTKVKSIFTKEKVVKQDNTNFYIEFRVDNYTLNANNKKDLEVYINGYDTKLEEDYYEYDKDKKLIRIGIPALLVDEVDLKVNNSLIPNAYAADVNGIQVTHTLGGFNSISFANMNTINLKAKPGYAEGDSYTVNLTSSDFDYCGVNGVNCYSFTNNMGPGNYQVSNNVFDYDYTYFVSNGSYYASYKYEKSGNTATATFDDAIFAYPFKINLTKLSGTYLNFTGARKIPSTIVQQRISDGDTVTFDQDNLDLPFFCLHAGTGGSHTDLAVVVKVVKKTTDYMILSLISNNKYYGQSANAYIKVTWKKYISIKKTYDGIDDGQTRRFSVYKSLNGTTCAGVTTAAARTQTKWSNGYYYLGWEGTEADWNNSRYGYPTLDPGVYCVWESSDNGSTFREPKNYDTKYTYNGNDVTRTDDGYTFGKITITGNEKNSSNTNVDYAYLEVKNTMKGYIKLNKQYVGTNDGQTRYFGLYKSHNGECESITSRDLIDTTSGTGTTFYLGWDYTNSVGMLDYGETYCIWESNDSTYRKAPDNYSVTYDNTQYDDDWVYGKVTLNGSNTTTEGGLDYVYKTATVTNTAEEKSKVRVKKTIEGQDNTGTNTYYQNYHFKYYVYPDGCTRGSTSGSCSTVELCTNNNGVTDYYGVDGQGNPTLPRNSTYVVEEEVDNNGNAVIYNSNTCTTQASGTSVPVLKPNHLVRTRTLSYEANTVGYGNSENNPSPITLKIQKHMTPNNSFDFSIYHFRFVVYLNSPSCTASSYGGTGVESSIFYTDDSGIIDVQSIGDVDLTEDNLNDTVCIVETVRSTSTLNSKIYDSNHRAISNSSLPFYSKAINRPVSATISDLTNSGSTYNVNVVNSVEKGYIEVQKIIPEISNFDFSANRFGFNIYDENDSFITTIYTDEYGYASYGKGSNNHLLDYNSVYYIREVVDPVTGDAIIYNPDHTINQNANIRLQPSYSSSSERISVKITNVGSGTNGKNSAGSLTNIPLYGYITIIKSFDDSTGLDFRYDHIGFNIYDSNNQLVSTVYTDSTRRATYGLDSTTGNPTLNIGDTYYIEEILDNGYAVIFDNNYQPKSSDVKVKPTYLATGNNVSVTIAEGNNSKNIMNETDYGYIEVQKSVTTTISNFYSTYHFGYNIYDSSDNYITTIITDNNGVAKYGLDSLGNPYLYYNETYYVREEMNGNYAKLYDSNNNEITTASSNYIYVQPQYPQGVDHETVSIQNLGKNTANVSTISNNIIEYGYVGVQKVIPGQVDYSTNHFKYEVTGPNVPAGKTVCTNDSGLAIYGADSNGNGELVSGNTYTFTEVLSNGYAVVYTDLNCGTESQSTSKPVVKPDTASVSVTVTNTGLGVAGLNTSNYGNHYLGYVGVEKTAQNGTIELTSNHFAYEVYQGNTKVDTVCTDTSGKAYYGKDSNGNGLLDQGNSYEFKEVLTNGIANVYIDSNCSIPNESATKPRVKPVNNSVTATVTNIGAGTSAANMESYPNYFEYGYVGVEKTAQDGTIDVSTYHFKYRVSGPNVPAGTTRCTDTSGKAYYGLENNEGTLNYGTSYTFEEVTDPSGDAIVYEDNSCSRISESGNEPKVKPTQASITVTVNNVGSATLGANMENYPNSFEKGYAVVNKTLDSGEVNFNTYHFKYNITKNGVSAGTSCTDNNGKAYYGLENGVGTLDLGTRINYSEVTSTDGVAKVYTDNTCGTEITNDSNKPRVKPTNNSVLVTINNIGVSTAGENSENYPNYFEYGYVGVDKTVQNDSLDVSNNHFAYDVYQNNTKITTVCTDTSGKAYYGIENGTGILAQNSTYEFREVLENGIAKVYVDSACSIPNQSATKPRVKPVNNSVTVTVTNVGSGNTGANVESYPNYFEYGYVGVQKTLESGSIEYSTNHFKYEVSGPNVPAGTTVCTNNQGLATYGETNGQGELGIGKSYTFREVVDNYGVARVYRDSGCSDEDTTSSKPRVLPSNQTITVTVNNVGSSTLGANIENYPNDYEYGYVAVQKTVLGSTINFSTNHFKYSVTGPNVPAGTTRCTDDQGLATYGETNGQGELSQGNSYVFTEELSNGYATMYTDNTCSTPVSNPVLISPASTSVTVTVINVGSNTSGLNVHNYPNGYQNCLTIQKVDSDDVTITSDVATFELYSNNTCSGGVVATESTVNGIATFTGLTDTTYYVKETSAPSGYTAPSNNCKAVTASEQTSSSTSCTVNKITNRELYIGFYKTKEDGSPLTEATFKVKDSNGNYLTVSNPVSTEYNGCYVYTGENSEGSVLSVNNPATGLFCIAKVPSGTYIAEEQATGNDGYWMDNGTITGISTDTNVPTKGISNTLKNDPYVVTLYKTKETSVGEVMQGAKFKIKENGTDNYIKVSSQSSVTGYEGCYVYAGEDTFDNASELTTDSNGRICVIRVKGNTTYVAVETNSGDPAYYVNESISIRSDRNILPKSDTNTLVNGSYKLSFYKEKEDGTPLVGATFVVKKGNEYLTVGGIGRDPNYPDCYMYTGTTSDESSASIMTTDSNGRICITKVPNSNDYVAKEKSTGDPAYFIFENGEIALAVNQEIKGKESSNTLVNRPYVINFYKALENGTPVGGAEFVLTDLTGKYIEVEGISSSDGYNGCYIYKGLSDTKTSLTTITTSQENKTNGVNIGEACIIKIPSGTYKVTETKPVDYHTFGNDTTRNFETATIRAAMNDSNKYVNYKTEFEFTKYVTEEDGYSDLWKNLTTAELMNIPFTIYDSNNNPVSVVMTDSGVYEYAGNTIDGTSGTSTTLLYLNSSRKIYVYHLPKGTYSIKEVECCCEDTCDSPSSNTCYGFYSPKYNSESGYNYTFTIDECSTSNPTGNDELGNRVCTRGIATETLDNSPTEVEFTKEDFYSYVNPYEIVKFENAEEISAFDGITFKVYYIENGEKVYVNFAKVGDIGTCKTEGSYSEYRYIPEGTEGITTTSEIHTCGGHIKITHLCRGRKFYIEEVSVPGNSVFVLPDNEADRSKEIDLSCCQEEDDDKPSSTVIIDDKPTRIPFEKRDSKYGYLINDETTTFEVYRCPSTEECHPGDYVSVEERSQAGMTLVKFNPREVIQNDEEDSGIEVYRAITNTDNVTDYVTDLHPYQGKLVLRYLEPGYSYVLFETVSPNGYKLPNGRNRETKFNVSTATVDVEEVDVANKPTSLIIKKYDEEGNLLSGAQFRIYEGLTCDASKKPKDQERTLLSLKTIRDGVYENREVKDTNTMITCTDRPDNKCSDIVTTLTLDKYVNTSVDFDTSINQNNERVELQAGEILIQYLEYGHCYIIEEVKAPNGYSLPENEDDRFTMVTITKESDVVDTNKDLINKPTPFTFYKYDEYNNLIDGGEFKLQKLNSNKKYEDVTVTEEEINGKLFYKVDKGSTNKVIRTLNGEATVYYLEEGQYRIVETKAPQGMELPIKQINVSVFYVNEDGTVIGNPIITNKPKTEKVEVKPSASAELIVQIATGVERVKYGLIIGGIIVVLAGLIAIRFRYNKKNKEEK